MEKWDAGSAHRVVKPCRLLISDILALDGLDSSHGETRSQFLRNMVKDALASSSAK
ncbi:MAG: hypothetical protein FWF71_03290 [Actinomycetia bacterium]|nr:hypothetical protein [Actinomycetes bacterium]